MFFNAETGTITSKYSQNYSWKVFGKTGNIYLLTTTIAVNGGVLFFDTTTNTATLKSSTGYDYDTLIEDNGNYYIEYSGKTASNSSTAKRYTLYYNTTDGTVKVVKYYLGEI